MICWDLLISGFLKINGKRQSILTSWIELELNILLQLNWYNGMVCNILTYGLFLIMGNLRHLITDLVIIQLQFLKLWELLTKILRIYEKMMLELMRKYLQEKNSGCHGLWCISYTHVWRSQIEQHVQTQDWVALAEKINSNVESRFRNGENCS